MIVLVLLVLAYTLVQGAVWMVHDHDARICDSSISTYCAEWEDTFPTGSVHTHATKVQYYLP